MQEAIGEDPLGDHADPVGQAEQAIAGPEIGREAGERLVGHLDGLSRRDAGNKDRAVLPLDLHADFLEPIATAMR